MMLIVIDVSNNVTDFLKLNPFLLVGGFSTFFHAIVLEVYIDDVARVWSPFARRMMLWISGHSPKGIWWWDSARLLNINSGSFIMGNQQTYSLRGTAAAVLLYGRVGTLCCVSLPIVSSQRLSKPPCNNEIHPLNICAPRRPTLGAQLRSEDRARSRRWLTKFAGLPNVTQIRAQEPYAQNGTAPGAGFLRHLRRTRACRFQLNIAGAQFAPLANIGSLVICEIYNVHVLVRQI